jgi:hypothetical protein
MVSSEYIYDQHEHVDLVDDDDQGPPPQEPLRFEDWVDWYEPHITHMWRNMHMYRIDTGIEKHVGTYCDFWDFATFMYNSSHKMARPLV